LQEFLEEFEELAKRCRLRMREKAKIVVKYVDKETRRFWTRLEGYGDDYAKLKKKIMGAYSKNFLEDKPAITELIKLVKKSAKGTIEDKEDLDMYYRKFRNIVADLVEEEIINKRQQNKYFWKGLPQELRYAISDCLEDQDPDFKDYKVLETKVVIKVGHFVLRKAVAKRRWGRTLKKGNREESSDEESSEDKLSNDESSDEESSDEPKDKMIGYRTWVTSRLEEQSEKTTMNKGKDVQNNKDVIPEESEEKREGVEGKRDGVVGDSVWVADWQVKEKEIGILNAKRHVRCNEDVVSERKRKEDMLREEKGMSKILKELTKKDRTSLQSSQEQAIEIEEELESQLLGNFVECMATPPGIPAISPLASTKHTCSCYSTTITASQGYHERRGCNEV